MSATVTISNADLNISFRPPWTREDYALFIRSKALPEHVLVYDRDATSYTLTAPARFGALVGVDPGNLAVPVARLPAAHLFDYQVWLREMAFKAKRFAIWADCGLGKTPVALDWMLAVMAETQGKVLYSGPVEVCKQTMSEAAKFHPDEPAPTWLNSLDEVKAWAKTPGPGWAITNYHKFAVEGTVYELNYLAGFVLDESSILKGGGGVMKWCLIKSCKGIPYKLSLTATPAPNDTMEYASQASWLGKLRTEGEILWTFFRRNQKTNEWELRPHAEEAFYRFMASWSVYLRKPAAYGFQDPFKDVPEPAIQQMVVEATEEQTSAAMEFQRVYDPTSMLPQQRLGVSQRSKLSQIAKGFMYGKGEGTRTVQRIPSNKPAAIAKLVYEALAAGEQCLVWTVFDEESDILLEAIGSTKVQSLHGKDSETARAEKLLDFASGKIPVMISKASLLGYGMNFQFCTRMIFSGFDDSFERFYQAVRRCYRYGSTKQLQVYVPYIPGLEDHMWENILRKRGQWEADTVKQEQAYRSALASLVTPLH
jgi:hypothetical protein